MHICSGGPQEGHHFLDQTTECKYCALNNTLVTVNVSRGSFSRLWFNESLQQSQLLALLNCLSEGKGGGTETSFLYTLVLELRGFNRCWIGTLRVLYSLLAFRWWIYKFPSTGILELPEESHVKLVWSLHLESPHLRSIFVAWAPMRNNKR